MSCFSRLQRCMNERYCGIFSFAARSARLWVRLHVETQGVPAVERHLKSPGRDLTLHRPSGK